MRTLRACSCLMSLGQEFHAAWSAQVTGKAANGASGALDLVNFEHHQARAQLVKNFQPVAMQTHSWASRQSETFAPDAPTTIGPRLERPGPTAASEGRGPRS